MLCARRGRRRSARSIHGALDAYCDLYGSEAKLLQGVLTCTAEPWWWDRSKCSHGSDVACSGPLGCRVLDSVAEDQRRLWSARRRDTLNTARTAAIRQLRREGWAESKVAEPARVGAGRSVARGAASALRARAHDGAREGLRSSVLPGAEVGGVCARARAHVDVRAGRARAGEVRGWATPELRVEARAVPVEGGRCSGVPVSPLGRAGLLRRAVAKSTLGRDDDDRPALTACLGGSEGLLRDADDDRRARAAGMLSFSASVGLCPERSMSARPPAAPPPGGPAWGPRVSEANAGAGPTGRGRALPASCA